MSKNTIKINGARIRALAESASGKTIYEIAKEAGYSRNILAEAIRTGKASPVVVNLLRLYSIEPEEYELKEEPEIIEETRPEGEQLSIDDLASISRDELKEIVKEAIIEVLSNTPNIIVKGVEYDPKNQRFKLIAYREDLK